MASWNVPTIHATGDILSVTDWNNVANNEIFLYQAPYGSFYNNTGAAINGATTLVPLASTSYSAYGVSTNGTSVTVGAAGMYWMTTTATKSGASGSGNNFMRANIFQSGVVLAAGSSAPTFTDYNAASTATALISASASASGYQLQVTQTTGSNASLTASATENFFAVTFVGSA